ncbi:uncharacterized protein LOC117320693 [Pecten maximus]|uniref:uncharacterized protein LOC117320693 n=1 Tax=Pecten maximus TaxID=6579 RepID=UPI001458BEE6|nr:uncharacterized protein LOC117320693 [Pecten maximus]
MDRTDDECDDYVSPETMEDILAIKMDMFRETMYEDIRHLIRDEMRNYEETTEKLIETVKTDLKEEVNKASSTQTTEVARVVKETIKNGSFHFLSGDDIPPTIELLHALDTSQPQLIPFQQVVDVHVTNLEDKNTQEQPGVSQDTRIFNVPSTSTAINEHVQDSDSDVCLDKSKRLKTKHARKRYSWNENRDGENFINEMMEGKGNSRSRSLKLSIFQKGVDKKLWDNSVLAMNRVFTKIDTIAKKDH